MDAHFDGCGICKHLSNNKIYTFQNITAEIGTAHGTKIGENITNNNRKSFQQNRAQRSNLKSPQSQFVMCSSFNVFGEWQQQTVPDKIRKH